MSGIDAAPGSADDAVIGGPRATTRELCSLVGEVATERVAPSSSLSAVKRADLMGQKRVA